MRSALPAQGDRHENNPKTATFAGGGAGLWPAQARPAAYLSVGYFNGGGDVTAGPGGDIDKLDVTQITHLNYSFGLIYNGEKDETNAALKDPAHRHQIYLSPKVMADLQRLPTLRKQNPELKVLLSVGGWGARVSRRRGDCGKPGDIHPLRAAGDRPVSAGWYRSGLGISGERRPGLVESQPADRDNFTLLLKSFTVRWVKASC